MTAGGQIDKALRLKEGHRGRCCLCLRPGGRRQVHTGVGSAVHFGTHTIPSISGLLMVVSCESCLGHRTCLCHTFCNRNTHIARQSDFSKSHSHTHRWTTVLGPLLPKDTLSCSLQEIIQVSDSLIARQFYC